MCYGKLTPDALQKIWLRMRQLQKQDDDEDDKSWTAAGREFQPAGPQTAKMRDA